MFVSDTWISNIDNIYLLQNNKLYIYNDNEDINNIQRNKWQYMWIGSIFTYTTCY